MRPVAGAFFVAGAIAVFMANSDTIQDLRSVGAPPAPDYRNCAIQVLTVGTDHGASRFGAYVVDVAGGDLPRGPFRSVTSTMML